MCAQAGKATLCRIAQQHSCPTNSCPTNHTASSCALRTVWPAHCYVQSQRYGSECAQVPVENHRSGLQRAFDILRQNVSSSINKEVSAVGHRIVHGGSLTESCRLDSAAKAEVQRAAAFAPLHNPPALDGVRACEECFPGRSQVRTLPGHCLCMLDWRVPATFQTLPCVACKGRTWGEDICWVLTWLTAQCTCNNLAAHS